MSKWTVFEPDTTHPTSVGSFHKPTSIPLTSGTPTREQKTTCWPTLTQNANPGQSSSRHRKDMLSLIAFMICCKLFRIRLSNRHPLIFRMRGLLRRRRIGSQLGVYRFASYIMRNFFDGWSDNLTISDFLNNFHSISHFSNPCSHFQKMYSHF